MMHIMLHALIAYLQLSTQILIFYHQTRYMGIAWWHERGEWVGMSGGIWDWAVGIVARCHGFVGFARRGEWDEWGWG